MADYYDAFGGKIGEVEEVWAGDSFNRGTMDCCYTTAGVSNCISSEPAFVIGDSKIALSAVATVDMVTDKLVELQKQIDELRDRIKVEGKLRNELRTLKYKREVV